MANLRKILYGTFLAAGIASAAYMIEHEEKHIMTRLIWGCGGGLLSYFSLKELLKKESSQSPNHPQQNDRNQPPCHPPHNPPQDPRYQRNVQINNPQIYVDNRGRRTIIIDPSDNI